MNSNDNHSQKTTIIAKQKTQQGKKVAKSNLEIPTANQQTGRLVEHGKMSSPYENKREKKKERGVRSRTRRSFSRMIQAGPVNSGGTHQDLGSSDRNVTPTSEVIKYPLMWTQGARLLMYVCW